MPKISARRDLFFQQLGAELNEQQLDDLCFDFGIEAEAYDEQNDGAVVPMLDFEIAANRPDLLCLEALAHSLKMYLGKAVQRTYRFEAPKERLVVKAATKHVRPYVVAAVLRNVTLTPASYKSFIDFQDKLHQNYCRKRTLVSIGTHDLDSIKGPFVYTAKPPAEIVFQALKQEQKLNAIQLFEKLENDQYLKSYLHIIRDSPVYPVIEDANAEVLSLPPIINGNLSKMSPETKNIFIEVTAKDQQRAINILNCIVSNFAPFNPDCTVERVEVYYEESNETVITPQVDERNLQTTMDYVNSVVGVKLTAEQGVQLLNKMGITSKAVDNNLLEVTVPYYRTDILQQCDIAEDIAIAYGYNNIELKLPSGSTVGGQYHLNKMSDMIREETALCGFVECLNFVLCSVHEQTELLNRPKADHIVHIGNSATAEFQCVRSTLIPGLLKCLKTNQKSKLPIQLFELNDIVMKGQKSAEDGFREGEGQVGAVNRRTLCAVHSDYHSSGLEILHGLLDQVMLKLRVKNEEPNGYYLTKGEDGFFFPGLQATVMYKGRKIGVMGVLHPKVLEKIEWPFPAALIEIDVQCLINDF